MAWSIQVATWTSNNRYPGVFRTVQDRIRRTLGPGLGGGRLRLLSFGCSTGNEIAALRSYFPEALIFGCDVNRQAMDEARRALQFDDAQIFESTPENIAEHGPYDAIFAMSVFCRFPESQDPGLGDFRSLYPFDAFEDGVTRLARCLTETGILCLFNANYEFSRLPVATGFQPVHSPLIGSNGFVDRFCPDGRRLTHCDMLGRHYVHRPHGDRDAAAASDFLSCVYERRPEPGRGDDTTGGDTAPEPPAVPQGAPDMFRFGPDLRYCADHGLRATSLGYWFRDGGTGPRLTRAWFRSTFDGHIEQGPSWSVDVDPATEALLRHDLRPDSEPAMAVDRPRSLARTLRQLAGRTRDMGRRRLWGARA